jgi:hypothetical protein
MTEIRKQVLTGAVTFLVTIAVAWMLRASDLDKIAYDRLARAEFIATENVKGLEALIAQVHETSVNQLRNQELIATHSVLIAENTRQIGELTAEVRDILKLVTRLEALAEKK